MGKNIFTREFKSKTNLIVGSILLTLCVEIVIMLIFIFWKIVPLLLMLPIKEFDNQVLFVSIMLSFVIGFAIYCFLNVIKKQIEDLKKNYKKIK